MDRHWQHPKQRGATLIFTVLFMMLAVLSLALVVDTGRLYVEKRNLQRIADIAALEIASRGGCALDTAQAIAVEAAARNQFVGSESQRITARCGYITVENQLRVFTESASDDQAVEAEVSRDVPASLIVGGAFRDRIRMSARATALRSAPTTVFRIGSKLINTNPAAPLMSLVKLVGLNLDDTLIGSYGGLANIRVTPSGLLNALGIPVAANITAAGLNELLAVNTLSVGDVLDAVVTVAGQDGLLGANVQLLNAIEAGLGIDDLQIQLGTDPSINSTPGLFAVVDTVSASASSALDVGVDALGLVTTALGIATKEQGIKLDLGGNNILTGLKAGLRVVEPQSIGVGGVGTTANNAQVRLNIDLNTNNGLTGILQLLGTSIKLPITIDTVQAVGTVTEINCQASPRTATIRVDSAVANACLGKIAPSAMWSTKEVCASSLQDETFVRLLGINILRGQVELPVLAATPEFVTLEVGETKSTSANTLAIGTLLGDLLDELLDLLGNSDFASEPLSESDATQIADTYLSLPELSPTGSGGSYTNTNLNSLQNRLDNDGLNWDRPGFLGLFNDRMLTQWRSSVGFGCNISFTSRYRSECVRDKLIDSLQTDAAPGFLGALLGGLLGSVVKPLLGAVLSPVIDLLSGLLNSIGSLLSNILSNIVGVDLGRSDVTLDSLSCGAPELVI